MIRMAQRYPSDRIAQRDIKKVLLEAKIDGRRALPRDELVNLAVAKCSPFDPGRREQRGAIERQIDVWVADGSLKSTATGKLSLGKKREMKVATAANGFERASDLPSGVLAHVSSFLVSVAAVDTSSRLLSDAMPWRTLALSEFPSLRLLFAAEDVDQRAWRGIYWKLVRMSDAPRCGGAHLKHAPPSLDQYIFTFEIWENDPRDSAGNLIECGTWNPGSGRNLNPKYSPPARGPDDLIYNGVVLDVSFDDLSAPTISRLRNHASSSLWFRSMVAKRGSIETYMLYDDRLCADGDARYELNDIASFDLIYGNPRYCRLEERRTTLVARTELLEKTDFSLGGWSRLGTAVERYEENQEPDLEQRLLLALQWQDGHDGAVRSNRLHYPVEVSHFEQFLAHRADWS